MGEVVTLVYLALDLNLHQATDQPRSFQSQKTLDLSLETWERIN